MECKYIHSFNIDLTLLTRSIVTLFKEFDGKELQWLTPYRPFAQISLLSFLDNISVLKKQFTEGFLITGGGQRVTCGRHHDHTFEDQCPPRWPGRHPTTSAQKYFTGWHLTRFHAV